MVKKGVVKIYPYWDEKCVMQMLMSNIMDLHRNICDHVGIVFNLPTNNVAFINDYYEVDKIRYYF